MRIIDFHTHAFPDALAERAMRHLTTESGDIPAYLDGRLGSLLESMDRNGIERSVLCCIATRPEQFEPIFKWCEQIASDRIVPFPSVHPADPEAVERIGQIAKAGFKGIKMHPYYQEFRIDEPAMVPLLKAMSEHGLMLALHTGFDIAFERVEKASPRQVSEVIRRFPELKLITTHLGGWEQWAQSEEYLIGRNIYMETSMSLEFMDREQARRMLLRHPAEYLLFGTDSPWTDQEASIRDINELELGEDRTRGLFYDNACRFLD